MILLAITLNDIEFFAFIILFIGVIIKRDFVFKIFKELIISLILGVIFTVALSYFVKLSLKLLVPITLVFTAAFFIAYWIFKPATKT